MGALVLKTWKAEKQPIDDAGNYVTIVGRQGGLIAWILSHMGIDPTTTLHVSADRMECSSASLAGTQSRILPLSSVCSSYYGYYKPWKVALGILAFFVWLGFSMSTYSAWPLVTFLLIGLIASVAYYLLNRTLTLGFVEQSGVVNGIRFKRSVIENVDVNQAQAKYVCELLQELIEKKISR